ncbi:murein DD-endopeptidase MepM/ murein hydrolase activator NlpD [Peribacillus deserti]|uniref:Murein DD-endopeptidase MepM/ murein hydrolase activator NlpD n=1 Tax=Peribacillus deserti TaxID=673318 RepID=A0ABS2QLQ9_9BACI|nr:M23 family metallopeptidase [Peribacillus deserti]MBM7694113.1 murein DD-endopeptidase MepM/ murein hydrolase activator NlpD [Peribacillus deserti]
MLKKNIILHVSLAAGLGALSIVQPVQASTINQMEDKKHQVQQKRQEVESHINRSKTEISNLKGKQASVSVRIQNLTELINKTTVEINEKSKQIQQTNLEVEELKKEIIVIKERMEQREQLLKERARSMQESGGNADYLEVLLDSKSFGNFIERVSAVAAIMEADQEILRQQEADKQKLEYDQKMVETKLANLEKMMDELQQMKTKQKQQIVQLTELMKKLKTEEKEEHAHEMDLREQEELLSAQESSIQQAINLETKRQAELEEARKRAAEEARQRAAAAAKEQQRAKAQQEAEAKSREKSVEIKQPARAGSYQAPKREIAVRKQQAPAPRRERVQVQKQQASAPSPVISGGSFTRPAAGVLSSNYGARWGTTHMGVDIASGGYVPVVSAADGVVSRAYQSSSYGNVVFISHSINGQVYTTVYAHLQNYGVSTGQVVAKGQQIGVMGNTGQSTGQHLHFELHNGAWNAAKSNAVNPIGIVPF